MIAIIDYGVGNLFSLSGSLKKLELEAEITSCKERIEAASHLILPGVGAFGDARTKLEQTQLTECIYDRVQRGVPLLGICLGMQMLFDESFEYGQQEGLGLIPGRVVPIEGDCKVPHMGWNQLHMSKACPILKYTAEGAYVYYVHSYYATHCELYTAAWSQYGVKITGVVQHENIFGTQFHPEKSGETGLDILRAFSEL